MVGFVIAVAAKAVKVMVRVVLPANDVVTVVIGVVVISLVVLVESVL